MTMTPYEKAMRIIEAEHEIVGVVYKHVDRLNDDVPNDPLEKIAADLRDSLKPVISKHLSLLYEKTQ